MLIAIASLGMLFVVATALHAHLYDLRPAPRYLTLFYLVMSAGGVLGGLVCCAGLCVTASSSSLVLAVNYFGVNELLDGLARLLRPSGLLVLGVGEVTGWSHPQLTRTGGRQTLAFLRNP